MKRTGTIAAVVTILAVALLAGCASKPAPVAEVKSYVFWPEAPDTPRIQYLTSFSSSADCQQQKSSLQDTLYGRESEQVVEVGKPYGVAMWNGRIYVCDVRGNSVMVFDVRQRQTRLMGSRGAGAIQRAVDIVAAPDGTKYVADLGSRRISVYDADERFVRSFSFPEWSPVSLAVYGNLLYVVDFAEQHVKVLDRFNGKLLSTIGGPGGEDGLFVRPLGIAVDADGNIFVTDVIKCRVQKFSPEGELLLAFGETGDRPGFFVRPKHLKVASDNILYVVDASFNNVQLFDEEGLCMMFFGMGGAHHGAMELPAGIYITDQDIDLFKQYIHPAFKAERLIIVTNQLGPHAVSVYAMGQLHDGKTVEDVQPGRISVPNEVIVPTETPPPAAQPEAELTAVPN
jgi:sugar lactone lactonase YvrE